MASSRSATPASREATPELLTPRSKIKALLATVDSSDDEDGPQTTATKKRTSLKSNAERRDIGDDSDSDVQIRPRGKLASRMQGVTATANEPKTAATTETARDRVKKMLERQREDEEEEAGGTNDADMPDADDEEDEHPVAPRRLKRRVPQELSPNPTELPARSPSPGLFVSSPVRPSPMKAAADQPESDDDLPAIKSDRFKALVERKKQERLAREAAEEARKAERRAQQGKLTSELGELESEEDNMSGITDDEGGRQLTQQARPTRKASRKAIEEMNRETQRMARSMQLAHEAKTRKKLTKAGLFERFNFRPGGEPHLQPEPQANSSSRPGTPPTDAETQDKDTPPSSPPVTEKPDAVQENINTDVNMEESADEELPSLADVFSSSPQKLDKGKGKAPAVDVAETSKPEQPKRRVRVRLPIPTTKPGNADSDDELEITTTTKDKINAVFNSIPFKKTQESTSLQALRALAQVKSPRKDNRRKGEHEGMTPGELQVYLQQKAKEQAKFERERRLEMLKAQGMVVQTSEERERQMQEVEDILAKAREEAQRIQEEERAAAKKENTEDGEADPLAWDDSEDEEYEDGENDADAEASAVELSGSEEEDDDEEGEEEEDTIAGTSLFETEADDAASEASEVPTEESKEGGMEDEEAEELPRAKRKRARNYTTVLSDDEAEVAIKATPRPTKTTAVIPASDSPAAPTSVLRSAKKTFIPGLPVTGPAGLSLTQIFAGTIDDSQKSQAGGPTQSMMPDFDQFPDSNSSAAMDEDVDDMIVDSQRDETQMTTQGVQLNLAQTQMHGLDSLLRDDLYSQMSEMMEPSQDGGFQAHTPLKQRFIDPPTSTVETVAVEHGATLDGSPLVRRGRLRRRMDMSSDDETSISLSGDKTETVKSSDTAFSVMKDAAKREKKKLLLEEFNRKKSKAKQMVEEQAEESEDEYAGLGGVDGEDSDDESTASVKDLIDDDASNNVDERKLAAFYADRERANDEKAVEKLYKDITSGMLRRKRGADYDLSDSDDGGEARRKMKRRQFAKMQKALYADERVKKMAENPGNQAFLRTIEDRGSDDEVDLLDIADEPAAETDRSLSQEERPAQQDQGPLQIIPDSQPRKPLGDAGGEDRPPAHLRRTKDGKKPSNIGEVRETLSDLLEERHGSIIPATEAGSDSEGDEEPAPSRSNKENQSPNPRRRPQNTVVDRISLKRNASSTASNANRLAFAATGPTSASSSSSFKVPSLLRRATTNSSLMSGSVGGTSTSTTSTSSGSGGSGSAGGFGEEAKIKKSAGKKSGVNGFARDGDRHARMQESERRRQEKKVRGAESRVGLVGGLFSKGSFE